MAYAESLDKGHGRLEIRRLWATDALNDYLEFPYCGRVAKIERETKILKTQKVTRETAYVIFSRGLKQAKPDRLLELVRGHWSIENRLHWVRDYNYDEDRSQARTGSLPWMMASLRNLAISLLRCADHDQLAPAMRQMARKPHLAVRLIGA